MNRLEWLRERRWINEERMDTLFAPIYDTHWGSYINPTHQHMLNRFLTACPSNAHILDAACGTGKYWGVILDHGYHLDGVDHSHHMLTIAHTKHPTVPLRKLGLQELDDQAAYDGMVCIDAMENICPEDWPRVVQNFSGALRADGLLYVTVEVEDADSLDAAFHRGLARGLPLVAGEIVENGSYHYYPTMEQVHMWLHEAQFSILHEMAGDGYHHLLARAL